MDSVFPQLPAHCVPQSQILIAVSIFLQTCIPSWQSLISTALGLVSITSWLFAQIPQIIKNSKRGSVEGLSWGFLMMWLLGDICNLLGAVCLDQMWFQQIIAAYYVCVDAVLVTQFLWYGLVQRAKVLEKAIVEQIEGVSFGGHSNSEDDDDDRRPPPQGGADLKQKRTDDIEQIPGNLPRRNNMPNLAHTVFITISLLGALAGAFPVDDRQTLALPTGLPSLGDVPDRFIGHETVKMIGFIVGWSSTILYLCSRLPQLILNAKRRSTEGLSLSLFVAAFSGNLFYSSSLILNPLGWYDYEPYGGGGIAGPEGNIAAEWWRRTLPFFFGAFGVLAMDATVALQFKLWGHLTGEKQAVEDGEGERETLLVAAVRRPEDGYGAVAVRADLSRSG